MAPKKSNNNSDVLSGSWISEGGDVDLLRRLLTTSSHLESLNSNNNNNNTNTKTFSDDFLDELLRRPILRHPNPEVRLVVGCIIADVLRLSIGPQTSVAAAASASGPGTSSASVFPWKGGKETNAEIIQLLVTVLTSTQPTAANLPYRRHILEALSKTHALIPLIRLGKLSEKDQSSFFNGLLLVNQNETNSGGNSKNVSSSATSNIDDSYASYASSAVSDLLAASQSISQHQVETIISALCSGTGNILNEDSAAATTNSSNSSVKKIAASLLRRNDLSNEIQGALIAIIADRFEDLANKLNEGEIAGDITDAQKKQRIRELQTVADRVTDIASASPSVVALLLPKMAGLAMAGVLDSNDARIALVKSLTRAYLTVPALAVEYQGPLFSLTHLLNDNKPQIRSQIVNLISGVLSSHQNRSLQAGNNNNNNNTNDVLWSTLSPFLGQTVNDVDENVRKNALLSIFELARLHPDQIPMNLFSEAGQRISDKKPAVRALAMEKFAVFYQNFRPKYIEKCRWIPGKILATIASVDGEDLNLDRIFETLLPAPSRVAADSSDSLLFGDAAPTGKNKKNSLFGGGNASNNKQQATLFDLGFGNRNNNNNSNNNQSDTKPGSSITFIEGLLTLLEDLQYSSSENNNNNNNNNSSSYVDVVFRMINKKTKLRLCLATLYSTRDEAKKLTKDDFQSKVGQGISDRVRRLINVLRDQTKTPETVWDTLFKLRDERAIKGLLELTSNSTLDFLSAREEARSRCGASLKKDVMTHVESVLPRIALPLTQTHVSELVHEGSSLREALYRYYDSIAGTADSAASSPTAAAKSATKKNKKQQDGNNGTLEDAANTNPMAHLERRYIAVINALHIIELHSPQLLAHHAKDLISWISTDGSRQHKTEIQPALVRLLQIFSAVGFTAMNNNNSVASGAFSSKKKDIALALGKFCLHSSSAAVGTEATSTLVRLFPDDDGLPIFKQFVPHLKSRLADVTKDHFAKWSENLPGWMAVFQTLCQKSPSVLGAAAKEMYTACCKIFTASCRAVAGNDPTESMAANAKIKVVNSITNAKETVLALNTSTTTLSATLVELSSRAIVAYAQSLPNASTRYPVLQDTYQLLIDGLKSVASDAGAAATISSTLKRLAIYKAMLIICENPIQPSQSNVSNSYKIEISTATCISSETNAFVRAETQKFIASVFSTAVSPQPNPNINVRFLSLLITTAVSEEHRTGYNFARTQVAACVANMQKLGKAILQVSGGSISNNNNKTNNSDDDDEDGNNNNLNNNNDRMIPFDDGRAFRVHAEYCIPFITLFLAHHGHFESEKSKGNFNAFQRVWHLLFEVTLKASTQTLPFIEECLRKLKSFDDGLNPDSSRTREVVDLGAKVLQQFLSNRNRGTGSYPGRVLLPFCFVQNPKSKFSADKVYLADEITVPVQVPFRVAPSVTPSKFGGATGLASLGASDNDESENNNTSAADGYDVDSSGQRRGRYVRKTNNNDSDNSDEEKEAQQQPQKKPLNSASSPNKKGNNNKSSASPAKNNNKLDQDAAAAASGKKTTAKRPTFPSAPKGMDKTVASVIRSICEACDTQEEILGLKMKFLSAQIQEKTGEKPSAEVKEQVKEYAGSIIQYFGEMEN